MKFILTIFLFISTNCFAQQADFIILKKHNKKISTWFAGDNIAFLSTGGTYIDAHINGIKNDTLYLQQFIVRRLPTVYGAFMDDTVGSYHYKYHYNQIKAFGSEQRKGFNMQASGMALVGGGALITLGSGIVYLFDRQKFSAPLLFAAVGLGVAGYFMSKDKTHAMTIGKKYKLQYMDMSDRKK
jgi:hypothetical protein